MMDSAFGEWGTALRVKNDKFLHCWVWLIGDIFLATQKHTMVYVVLFPGTSTEDAAEMTSRDKTFLMI